MSHADGRTDVTTRVMRGEDAPDLFEIYNQPAFRFGTLALPYESLEAVKKWAEPRSPRELHLVAELNHRVVDAAALRPFYGRGMPAAEFWLAVHEDFMGSGIGSRLLAEMIDTSDNWAASFRNDAFADVHCMARVRFPRMICDDPWLSGRMRTRRLIGQLSLWHSSL